MATNRRPSQPRRDLIIRKLLESLKREELCQYVGEHDVNHSNERKEELLALCLHTARLNVPVIDRVTIVASRTRGDGQCATEKFWNLSTSLQWSSDLRGLSTIAMLDVG